MILAGFSVHAQQDSIKGLEEVVVTGQFKPQSLKHSVYQVKVINRDRIEKQGATRIQDVLNTELNVRFTQDLATGGTNINMLGMSGQNVKVLLDGLPLTGRQGTSNEININQIDINTVERIEIVEGPMAVIYGADALAGVINIITRKQTKSLLSVNARVHEETAGKEYGIGQGIHNQSLGVQSTIGKWTLGANISRNFSGGWKDTATGRELMWHRKKQLLGGFRAGWQHKDFSINYRIEGLDENIFNPGNFQFFQQSTGDILAQDQEYITQRILQQLHSSWKTNDHLSFLFQGAYTTFSRQVFSTTVSQRTGDVRLNTAPGAQSLDNFNGITARLSSVYQWSPAFSIQPGIDINMENGSGDRLEAGVNRIGDYAMFLSAEVKPNSFLFIRSGLRFINNTVYDAPPVIPSLNVKINLSEEFDIKLAYAKGFRAPSLRELYYNFFDANHQIVGNPELKAETSNSLTSSVNWKRRFKQEKQLSAGLTFFYNDVRNLINYGVSLHDPNVFRYVNIDRFKSRGINLALQYKDQHWDIAAGPGFTARYNALREKDPALPVFRWSPEANLNIGYSIPSYGFNISLYYKFTGRLPFYQLISNGNGDEILLNQIDRYHWADITLNKKIFRLVTINTGVRNLFNLTTIGNPANGGGTHSPSVIRSIGYGRSFFAGLQFNWEKKSSTNK